MRLDIEARSSQRPQANGYVTGVLWNDVSARRFNRVLLDISAVMRQQAPRDGVAVIIRRAG